MNPSINNQSCLVRVGLAIIARPTRLAQIGAVAMLLGVLCSMSSCATTDAARSATPPHVAALDGVDQAAYRRGRIIALTDCSDCHRVYKPRDYSPQEWSPIARAMGKRSSLSDDQINDLKVYLQAASQR